MCVSRCVYPAGPRRAGEELPGDGPLPDRVQLPDLTLLRTSTITAQNCIRLSAMAVLL